MRRLNERLDVHDFFQRLRRASERILFVDYDGTLAPFAARAELAVPYPGVAGILNEIAGSGSSIVVLVSGRDLSDMQVPLAHIRATEVWASHGWQHTRAGGPRIDYTPDGVQCAALDRADRDARALEALGARVERKPGSVAVHWRGLDPITVEVVVGELRCRWPAHETNGLDVLEFDAGLELRSRRRTKGHAVSETLDARGRSAVSAYLGDDLTDEDAFRAMQGRGISALVRSRWRPTSADLWLTPPRGLIKFLRAWHSSASP
jgi:trehalose 6-phosphate phosphatase